MRFFRRTTLLTFMGGLAAACHPQPDESTNDSNPEVVDSAESAVKSFGPIDEDHGFPRYYEDTAGLRLQPCIDGSDVNCILDPLDGVFVKEIPTVFPTNFPDEFFYAYAESERIATPGRTALGCGAGAPGRAFALAGLEGSFLNGVPLAGDQMVFGRIRIVASGLCPTTEYDFVHPYGTERVKTNDLGQVTANVKGYTQDIGCFAAPCDFSLPYQGPGSRVFTSFAQWDPADLSYGLENAAGVTVPTPGGPLGPGDIASFAGYIGDAATLHTIIGTPNNRFELRAAPPGSPVGSGGLLNAAGVPTQTNYFVVAGKVAGDLTARAVGFGGQDVGTASAPRQITVTNWSQSAMTLGAITIGGVDAADFALTADAGATPCAADLNLARDASCTISLAFSPTVLGARSATVDVAATRDDGAPPLPLSVAVSGTGTNPGDAPIVSFDTALLDFGNIRVASASSIQNITLTNTGNAPLEVTGLTKGGLDAADFTVVQDTCSSPDGSRFFDPGMTCFVSIKASPSVVGARNATISISDNAGGSPHAVALTANGTGGLSAVAAANTFGFPDWYQDENGAQIVPCYDQVPDPANPGLLLIDPLCLLPPDTETLPDGTVTWDQSLPLNPPAPFTINPAAPVNFPGESFYYAAEALLEYPDCADATKTQKSVGLIGLESTWAAGTPISGDQIVFGRKRFFSKGLCPLTDYQITTPYGTEIVTSDADGMIKANTKVDTGCLAAPCNFGEAMADPLFNGMLRWDPAVAPAAPPGYLGDGFTPHSIIGGTYTAPGSNTPVDYYEIKNPDGTILASTNQWTVWGKTTPVREAPQPVAFPATSLTASSPMQTVTITNTDPVNANTINSLVIDGTNPGDFQIAAGTDTCTGAVLTACPQPPAADPSVWVACPATSSCTVGLIFNPTTNLGQREAALRANHTAPGSTPATAKLTGLAGEPNLVLQPSALVFDDQQQLEQSYPHTVVVRNTGNAPLDFPAAAIALGGVDAGEFTLDAENCSGNSVAAGGTCEMIVTFFPQTIGAKVADIAVLSNDADSPHSLPLSGLSITPSIGVASAEVLGDPAGAGHAPTMTMQDVLWQTSTAFQADGETASSVTITNVGLDNLAISSLDLVGQHPGDFAILNDTCEAAVLAPTGTCTFDVVFTPQSSGVRSATVNIYNVEATDTLAVVHVGGTGLAPVVPAIAQTSFVARTIFQAASAGQNIVLTNNGDGNLIIPAGGVTMTGSSADYIINSDTCSGQTVAPGGGTCTVNVSFLPLTRGVKNAVLHVAGNTLAGEVTANITGTGQAPVLQFSNTTFGNQKIGTSSTKGFSITNSGDAPLTITGAIQRTITDPVADSATIQFSIPGGGANKCTAGTVLQPGKNCSFNVTFAPVGPVQQGNPLTATRRIDLSVTSTDPLGAAASKKTTSGIAIP